MEIISEILMAFVFALLANFPTIFGMKRLKLLFTSIMFVIIAIMFYTSNVPSDPIINIGFISLYYVFDSYIDHWITKVRKKVYATHN